MPFDNTFANSVDTKHADSSQNIYSSRWGATVMEATVAVVAGVGMVATVTLVIADAPFLFFFFAQQRPFPLPGPFPSAPPPLLQQSLTQCPSFPQFKHFPERATSADVLCASTLSAYSSHAITLMAVRIAVAVRGTPVAWAERSVPQMELW